MCAPINRLLAVAHAGDLVALNEIDDVRGSKGARGRGTEIGCQGGRGGSARIERHLLATIYSTIIVEIQPGKEIPWLHRDISERQLLPCLPHSVHLTKVDPVRIAIERSGTVLLPVRRRSVGIAQKLDIIVGVETGFDDVVFVIHQAMITVVLSEIPETIHPESLHIPGPSYLFIKTFRKFLRKEVGLVNRPVAGRR